MNESDAAEFVSTFIQLFRANPTPVTNSELDKTWGQRHFGRDAISPLPMSNRRERVIKFEMSSPRLTTGLSEVRIVKSGHTEQSRIEEKETIWTDVCSG